jgi:hypothetical protein
MALLKISLWVTGIACLLSVPGIFMPVSSWQPVTEFFGIETLPDSPLFVYMARLMCATYAGTGIYFIILALRPVKHGVLVPFSGLVCVLLGVFCWMTGKETAMPAKWYLSDSLSALILGVLILLFWLTAKKPKAKSV